MPFSKPDLTEAEFPQLNAQERQARADEHGVLSAEKRMALAFKVRSQMLGIVDGRIDLSWRG
jgi:hypothetical protein